MYQNIPGELRALRQWIVWAYQPSDTGKPTKIPLNPINGHKASVTNPLDWNTFDYAVAASRQCNGIGFVFTKSDPYCGVDIDDYNSAVSGSEHKALVQSLATYRELSPSGNGSHVIARCRLSGSGRRRNGIEIYDNARFFTFTGNRQNNFDITDQQDAISKLYDSFTGPRQLTANDFLIKPETRSDNQIIEAASAAHNGHKFTDLWNGDWELYYGNRSQSEADLALINIIAFYTQSRAQIARLFRASALGRREKAKRNDYITWMINKAFDRLPKEADLDMLYNMRLELLEKHRT